MCRSRQGRKVHTCGGESDASSDDQEASGEHRDEPFARLGRRLGLDTDLVSGGRVSGGLVSHGHHLLRVLVGRVVMVRAAADCRLATDPWSKW